MPARTARCPLREVRPRQRREQQVEQNTESYNPPRKRKVTQYYTIFASWKVQVARIAEHFAHRQHTLFRRDRLPFRLRRRSGRIAAAVEIFAGELPDQDHEIGRASCRE